MKKSQAEYLMSIIYNQQGAMQAESDYINQLTNHLVVNPDVLVNQLKPLRELQRQFESRADELIRAFPAMSFADDDTKPVKMKFNSLAPGMHSVSPTAKGKKSTAQKFETMRTFSMHPFRVSLNAPAMTLLAVVLGVAFYKKESILELVTALFTYSH